MDERELSNLLQMMQGTISRIAQSIYRAQEDGKIEWAELLPITMALMAEVPTIIAAFKGLSKASMGDFLNVLATSDLGFIPRGR